MVRFHSGRPGKKLEAAARSWADAVTGAKIGEWEALVWQENWDAIRVLAACGTQWRSVAMGGISGPERLVALGLDYSAVESVMRILAISDPADTFWRLQLLEGVVLSAFAEHARAERARDFHHR